MEGVSFRVFPVSRLSVFSSFTTVKIGKILLARMSFVLQAYNNCFVYEFGATSYMRGMFGLVLLDL